MREYVFLFRSKEDDRDCCAYIENSKHKDIIGRYNRYGACYSNSEYPPYEEIETILTKEEYEMFAFGDDNIEDIIKKLQSKEAKEFEDKIMESEKEYMMNEYSLCEGDMNRIFANYSGNYRDRGIISYVFEDAYDCGYEEAWSLGYVNNNDDPIIQKYFDFEKFGQDLADEDSYYLELSDGRIVRFN